ncbi:MAG: transposase [Bacteroidota bacterium]
MSIAEWVGLDGKLFERQYKDHLSDFSTWNQKDHADKWLLFPDNLGTHLSLDETSVSNGELYSVLTNKAARGGKGSLVAMVEGTKTNDISLVFNKIPLVSRETVVEVTLDFSSSMETSARIAFPNARITTDRFHVQQLVSEALQEMRVSLRWKAIREENEAVKQAKNNHKHFTLDVYSNGDTKKQLLARSRYLLFKPESQWTVRQKERAVILFQEFSELKEAYKLSMSFRNVYQSSKTKKEAQQRLTYWYKQIEEKNYDSFMTAAEYLKGHEDTILNYFPDRQTNASAESFNAKLKGFRALVRGVRDTKFFLFRVMKLYA